MKYKLYSLDFSTNKIVSQFHTLSKHFANILLPIDYYFLLFQIFHIGDLPIGLSNPEHTYLHLNRLNQS